MHSLRRIAVPLVGVLILVFFMVAGPVIWGPQASATDPTSINAPASAEHLLGTDQLGRDILSRVFAATRLSLMLALAATILASVLGSLLGIMLSMSSPRVMNLGMRLVDGALAFPGLLFAIILAAILGPSATTAVLSVSIAGIPSFIRLACNLSTGVMGMDYVKNARVVGVGPGRLIQKYLVPNVIRSMGITVSYDVGLNLVVMSSLSFLGLGVQLPEYDWGRLLAEGMRGIHVNVFAAIGPVVAIAFSGLVFASVGELLSATGATRRSGKTSRQPVRSVSDVPPSAAPASSDSVVDVRGLRISFPDQRGEPVEVVRGVSLQIHEAEIVGIIGESGSGKTLTAYAISDLLDDSAIVSADALRAAGVDILNSSARARRAGLRGRLSVVFQEPMSSLNPTMSIVRQLGEAVRVFDRKSRRETRAMVRDRLADVRISAPQQRLDQYPFELSGGMRQRAMIAMGLMKSPRLLVADEPTTALDVTVQAQILGLLQEIRAKHGVAVLLISHDLGVVRETCDRVYVMYQGQIVESGDTDDVLDNPQHAYTRRLLASVPDLDAVPRQRLNVPEVS